MVHSIEEHADLIANCLPNDRLWDAKKINETNLRKLLKGNAYSLQYIENKIVSLFDEYDPRTAEALISEWEHALGIPDGCIKVADNLSDRRNNVILKLTALGVQTKDDFIALGSRLGYTVEIISGYDFFTFPYTFPMIFTDSYQSARFSMIIRLSALLKPNRFDFTFPIIFGDSYTNMLECVFKHLIPSNVRAYFLYVL